jgi:hypothetical protein
MTTREAILAEYEADIQKAQYDYAEKRRAAEFPGKDLKEKKQIEADIQTQVTELVLQAQAKRDIALANLPQSGGHKKRRQQQRLRSVKRRRSRRSRRSRRTQRP